MFTGIIEATGTITAIASQGGNLLFTVQSRLSTELRVDQSLSHNGVCLTVIAIDDGSHQVEAVNETLRKTNLSYWSEGDQVNLERSLTLQQRLDGHIVQGHVDAVGTCIAREEKGGSQEYRIQFAQKFGALVIEKGAIALNGISLTVFDVSADAFSVAIIPYTAQHTNMHLLYPDDRVNLEFDLVGKYVARLDQVAGMLR